MSRPRGRRDSRDRQQERGIPLGPPPEAALPLARSPELITWLTCGYLLLIVGGYMLLLLGGIMPNGRPLSRDRAFFLAVDAATLTGFQTDLLNGADSLGGSLILLGLTLAGMMFVLVVGGMAVVRILGLDYSDQRVAAGAGIACAGSLAVGALFFWEGGQRPSIAQVIACLQRTASAFGNSGVISGKIPLAVSWKTQVVLLPLAVLGGLGITVLMEGWDWLRTRRPLSEHARTVLAVTAGVYLVSVAALALVPARRILPTNTDTELAVRLGAASATAVNARTAGLPFEYGNHFTRVGQWLLILLMAIGASSAGTGGGLKTTTLAALWRGVRDAMRGRAPGRVFGIACVWALGYFALVAVSLMLGLWTQRDLPADRILFETVSAASNVGLSFDMITTTREGLFILSGTMLMGRLLPLAVLWWMAQTTTDAELAVG